MKQNFLDNFKRDIDVLGETTKESINCIVIGNSDILTVKNGENEISFIVKILEDENGLPYLKLNPLNSDDSSIELRRYKRAL